jgi:TetR/AcrR family transcriptional regulator
LLNSKQATSEATLTPVTDRERNPARTRAAILDAAENLFAAKGFTATSLNEVGRAAGVSRGTPGYFFGSKADLYQAVLDRSFAEVREAVRAGRARAMASNRTADAILAGAVSDYFDFLAARPNFIRLIEREALNGGPQLDEASHLSAGQEALGAISAEVGLDDSPSGEAAQTLLSIIALCWFHLIHARTVAPAVGVTLENPEDLARRRRHVVGLVLHGLAGLERPMAATFHQSNGHD